MWFWVCNPLALGSAILCCQDAAPPASAEPQGQGGPHFVSGHACERLGSPTQWHSERVRSTPAPGLTHAWAARSLPDGECTHPACTQRQGVAMDTCTIHDIYTIVFLFTAHWIPALAQNVGGRPGQRLHSRHVHSRRIAHAVRRGSGFVKGKYVRGGVLCASKDAGGDRRRQQAGGFLVTWCQMLWPDGGGTGAPADDMLAAGTYPGAAASTRNCAVAAERAYSHCGGLLQAGDREQPLRAAAGFEGAAQGRRGRARPVKERGREVGNGKAKKRRSPSSLSLHSKRPANPSLLLSPSP